MRAHVQHDDQQFTGTALVVNVRNKYPLLGRDWLFRVKLDWNRIFHGRDVHTVCMSASQLQEKYEDVFSDQLGEIRGIEADIELDDNARPRFFRSRPVPFPLREKVNQELDRQLEEGARGQPRTTAQPPSAVRCAAAPREVPLLPEVCGVLGIHSHHRGSATERKEAQVASATAKDPVLSVVLGWARTGAWPGHANDSRLKPYLQRREQLTVIDGCVQLELPGSARYSSPSDTAVPPSVKRAGGVSGTYLQSFPQEVCRTQNHSSSTISGKIQNDSMRHNSPGTRRIAFWETASDKALAPQAQCCSADAT
ncbi:uncharacterized protein LOC122392297 isoform X4 [Amphibalanus amphitrite]|uniref:uncharacterized protein LOC122392297 isoform X4 n=1 Tax=Amphibalanus amphitrite TaxID=1232801 RepID=UPI001C91B147|nr:uncharacterized protein LOC122392297 isoform X4 [Amphibalanus amphitrite]